MIRSTSPVLHTGGSWGGILLSGNKRMLWHPCLVNGWLGPECPKYGQSKHRHKVWGTLKTIFTEYLVYVRYFIYPILTLQNKLLNFVTKKNLEKWTCAFCGWAESIFRAWAPHRAPLPLEKGNDTVKLTLAFIQLQDSFFWSRTLFWKYKIKNGFCFWKSWQIIHLQLIIHCTSG